MLTHSDKVRLAKVLQDSILDAVDHWGKNADGVIVHLDNSYDFPYQYELVRDYLQDMTLLQKMVEDGILLGSANIGLEMMHERYIKVLNADLEQNLSDTDKSYQQEEIAVLILLGETDLAKKWSSEYAKSFKGDTNGYYEDCLDDYEVLKIRLSDVLQKEDLDKYKRIHGNTFSKELQEAKDILRCDAENMIDLCRDIYAHLLRYNNKYEPNPDSAIHTRVSLLELNEELRIALEEDEKTDDAFDKVLNALDKATDFINKNYASIIGYVSIMDYKDVAKIPSDYDLDRMKYSDALKAFSNRSVLSEIVLDEQEVER